MTLVTPAPTVIPIAVLLNSEQIRLEGRRLDPIPLDARRPKVRGVTWTTSPLPALIRERLAPDELRSEPRALLPRHSAAGWVVPVLFVARARPDEDVRSRSASLGRVLADLADELRDQTLVTEANAVIRDGVLGDEFMLRITGESARTASRMRQEGVRWGRAISNPDIPWVIAGLPDRFSLTDLHRAAMAWLAIDESDAESPSNFRRRVQELVAADVLEEVPDPSRGTESDRPGRPPRLFRFIPWTWEQLLLRRSGSRSREFGSDPSLALRRLAELERIPSPPSPHAAMRMSVDESNPLQGVRGILDSPGEGSLLHMIRQLLDQYERGGRRKP
jgi:hypothetical protein